MIDPLSNLGEMPGVVDDLLEWMGFSSDELKTHPLQQIMQSIALSGFIGQ